MKPSKKFLGALVALLIGGCAGTQGSQLTAAAPAPASGGPSQVQPEVVASQQTANGRELTNYAFSQTGLRKSGPFGAV